MIATLKDIARPVRRAWERQRVSAAVGQLAASGTDGRRLAGAIEHIWAASPRSRDRVIAAIEAGRAAMKRRREEPLIDGTQPLPGPYDEGHSIADVVRVSRNPHGCLLLYSLVREFRPMTIIELGISSAYLAAGQAAVEGGRTVTLEASPYRQRLAREVHAAAG